MTVIWWAILQFSGSNESIDIWYREPQRKGLPSQILSKLGPGDAYVMNSMCPVQGSPPFLRQPPTVTVPTKTQEEWVFKLDELNCQLKLWLVRDLSPSFCCGSDRRRYHIIFMVRLIPMKDEDDELGPWDCENQSGFMLQQPDASWKIIYAQHFRRSGTHSRVSNLRVEPMELTSCNGSCWDRQFFFLDLKGLTFMSISFVLPPSCGNMECN